MALGDTQYILNKLTAQNGINLIQDNISVTEGLVSGLINQWDEQWEVGAYSNSTGEKQSSTTTIRSANFIPVKPNTTYYINIGNTTSLVVCQYGANKNYLSIYNAFSASSILTTNASTNYITFYLIGTSYSNNISINYPSSYTGYYPSKLPKTNAHIGGLGNAIANGMFNQLINKNSLPSTQTINGVTFTNNGDGSITANGTATALTYFSFLFPLINGHKYIGYENCAGGSASLYRGQFNTLNGTTEAIGITDYDGKGGIFTSNGTGNSHFYFYVSNGTTVSNIKIIPQLIDLTVMFGNGNEPTTIEDFKSMFPASYYPYNSGLDEKTGATDTSSKIYLVGATSQTSSSQTYSDNEVYVENGSLFLTKSQDASATADNKPALIIGGPTSGTHIEIDGNEIMAKSSSTTIGALYLNYDGGLVTLGTDGKVLADNGMLKAKSVNIAGGCTLLYDSTNKCINFIFN